MEMNAQFNQHFLLRVSSPQPRLISQGYEFLHNRKLFVRIFHMPHTGRYLVKIKLPKHATLHLLWDKADWKFEDDWLTFSVSTCPNQPPYSYDAWFNTEHQIMKTFDAIAFS